MALMAANQHGAVVSMPPDWTGIRPEYFKVWADFTATAEPFGVNLSERQLNVLGHLLVAMDLIDSAIDRQPLRSNRQQLADSVLSWMAGEPLEFPIHEQLDLGRLSSLQQHIQIEKIAPPFLAAAERVFVASEGKRNATKVSELVRCLLEEGQAAAEMTIMILGENTTKRFNGFLQRIMRIGTIVDTLLDADDDFAKGILKLTPGRCFRLRLKFAIARQLPGLILSFPNRRLLWRYCLSYTRDSPIPLNNSAHQSWPTAA